GKNKLIPIEDFFHEAEKIQFRISPNGKYISYLKEYEGIKNIYVLNIEKGSTERITKSKERDIQSAFWASNDEIIFLMQRNAGDSLRLMAVNRNTQAVRSILNPTMVQMRWVEPVQVINNEILISLNDRDSSVFDVYRLNVATGDRSL